MLLIIFFILIVLCYQLSKRKFDYWKKKNVPYLKPIPLIGNYGDFILQKTSIGENLQKICKNFPDEPYVGAFYGTEPTLIVQDPELIKLIFVKDFYYFNGREASDYADSETVTRNIFFQPGDYWRVVRQNLTPLYSTSKMKKMFPLIEKCSRILEQVLENNTQTCNVMDVSHLMGYYAMDSVGSCAFGIDIDLMQGKSDKNAFKIMGDSLFKKSTIAGLKIICRAIWPSIFYNLGFTLFPRETKQFFMDLLTGIFKERDYKPSQRNDFVDLVLTFANKENLTGDSIMRMKTGQPTTASIKVDNDLLTAQSVTFFGGAFETTASTLAMLLYELSKSEEIQNKVYEEVLNYLDKYNNALDYDCISKLPYLDACITETLRLHPVFPNLTREVMEEYTFPSGLRLERGVRIHIPVYHIHHNPIHFPKPEEFRPERFMPGEKANITPYTFLGFGDGHRICIGVRFAKMLMFAGLVTIIKSYEVKMPDDKPQELHMDPRLLITRPRENVYIKFVPRKNGRRFSELHH